jgi:3-oxoadipate enol-lactonase
VPTATANGIELFYERKGAGPRLLFFNGSGSSIATSELLINLFTNDFDVLVHDQRGLGRTEIPPGPFTMADYAADAIALLDHVEWDRARVIGISFGGMVAQEFAVTVPERVERLALLCTSPGGAAGASYPLHALESLSPEAQAAKGTELLDTRFTAEWLASHDGDRGLAEMLVARRSGEKDAETRRGEREQLDARRRHDVAERLGAVSCPTLVASGRYDGIAPPANGEAIAARVPGAQLRIYEGGHAFFAQDRAALPDIIGFLKGEDVKGDR